MLGKLKRFCKIIVTLGFCSFVWSPDYDEAQCSLRYTAAINSQARNPGAAAGILYEICQSCESAVFKDKAFRSVHELNKTFFSPNQFPNKCQLYDQGSITIESLGKYIIWITNNDKAVIEDIRRQNNLGTLQIQSSVKELSDLIARRGLMPVECQGNNEKLEYEQAHDIYMDVCVDYINIAAMEAWTNMLIRCQNDKTWHDQVTFARWQSITTKDNIQCIQRWSEFVTKLDSWIGKNPTALPAAQLRIYTQRSQTIHSLLEN